LHHLYQIGPGDKSNPENRFTITAGLNIAAAAVKNMAWTGHFLVVETGIDCFAGLGPPVNKASSRKLQASCYGQDDILNRSCMGLKIASHDWKTGVFPKWQKKSTVPLRIK
jgi:hypothetical protein